MSKTYELNLKSFSFPSKLSPNKSNFRFIFDVRYINKTGWFTEEHCILPSFDTFFECDPKQASKPNYVRDAGGGAFFDMNRIDDWDTLILCFRGMDIHSIQVKVFDVNRKDSWDAIKGTLAPIIEALLGRARAVIPSTLPDSISLLKDSIGGAAEDAESYFLKKIAGGSDKILFKGSRRLSNLKSEGKKNILLNGVGTGGEYKIRLELLIRQ